LAQSQLNSRNYFSIHFCDFRKIASSGQSHVTISLIGRKPHTGSVRP